jgi:hypothetical protein
VAQLEEPSPGSPSLATLSRKRERGPDRDGQ